MLHLTLLTQTSIQVSLRQMFWNVAFDLIKAKLLHILLLKVTVCYHIQPSVVFRMKSNLLKGYFIILSHSQYLYVLRHTEVPPTVADFFSCTAISETNES